MVDKYHNEWIIRNLKTDELIFKAQSRTFRFLSDMAYVLDSSIEMLEGIRSISVFNLKLELLERKVFYLQMANGIGRLVGRS